MGPKALVRAGGGRKGEESSARRAGPDLFSEDAAAQQSKVERHQDDQHESGEGGDAGQRDRHRPADQDAAKGLGQVVERIGEVERDQHGRREWKLHATQALPVRHAYTARRFDHGGIEADYSHSIVAGGFEVTSRTTLLTPGISFTIRAEIVSTRSYGRRAQSAVIASSLVTARITIG